MELLFRILSLLEIKVYNGTVEYFTSKLNKNTNNFLTARFNINFQLKINIMRR